MHFQFQPFPRRLPERHHSVMKPTKTGKTGPVSRFYWILGVIAAIGIGTIAWIMLRDRDAASDFATVEAQPIATAAELVKAARGVKVGPDSAPVRMLVFSDYQCPGCRHFAREVEPHLHREFVDSGRVQLIYYDYPLSEIHQWAFLASRAGRCAEDQNKFWPYHDKVFATQNDWSFEKKPPVSRFKEYAVELGLDAAAFETCLASDKHSKLIAANRQLGTELGVGSTPTIFIEGKLLRTGWDDYKVLRETVLQELARK
jgi:protein-disulfide isomerase